MCYWTSSSLMIEGIKYNWILSQIILLVIVVLKRKLRTCKFNNITDWNNICLLYSHFPLSYVYQCLNSSFASFSFLFLLLCFLLLFNVLLCFVDLVREPLLYFMFVSTFYFACVTWLCLDVLFGKLQIYKTLFFVV